LVTIVVKKTFFLLRFFGKQISAAVAVEENKYYHTSPRICYHNLYECIVTPGINLENIVEILIAAIAVEE